MFNVPLLDIAPPLFVALLDVNVVWFPSVAEILTVLAESAERAEDIDVARAEAAKRRAEERLSRRSEDLDVKRAEAALQRAVTRLDLARR